ncbi:MAG: hypothetical protein FWC80_02975 [Firmicutes bacterium]|nr:hypothetical protein [Bacillota bacterium]
MNDICNTKYPIVLVHGFALRDGIGKIWGKVPKKLRANGATVFVGKHDALGTIEHNANHLKKRIETILAQTGSEKVNIIAHSKGGLDSRRLINLEGMADKIASLTTIGTPHNGLNYVDRILKIPGCLFVPFSWVANIFYFLLGDKKPTFRRSVRGFSPSSLSKFNKDNPDHPDVYYQSYALKLLKGGRLRKFILRHDGDNDGLVSVEAAKWSGYRGILGEDIPRGVGHSVAVGLRRSKQFDACATFIQIVQELKEKGF